MAGDMAEYVNEVESSHLDYDSVIQPMGGDANFSVVGCTCHMLPFAQQKDRELSSYSKRATQLLR